MSVSGDPALATADRFVEIGGLRARVRREGDGPAVLVLHGWGAHIEAVAPISAALREVCDVVAVDLPGFGQSAVPPQPWGVADFSRWVVGLMDELGIERAHLVGHSHGGRVAIHLATEHPERVDRMLLIDSAGIRAPRTARWYWKVGLAKVGKYAAKLLGPLGRRIQRVLVGRAASTDYAAAGPMRPTLVRVVNEDLSDRLPRIARPTLLVWGALDEDTPLWMGKRMEELIPDAGLVVFEGARHYSYADEPVRFGRIAREFLGPRPPV